MARERTLRCAVIGAGMAGILAAIRLRDHGYEDVTVFEKADRLGGTWRENTYPGLACDVPSHLYSYSFAPNTDWTHRFSPGPEILAYFERIAAEHGIEGSVRYGDAVVACTWDGERWNLRTQRGHHDTADVVIAATGVLHHPRLPEIAGLDAFEGRVFHTARWDGDVALDGARVGVIGNGSTGVQIVAALVPRVAELSLFQRTAQWILPQDNPAYTDEQIEAFRADPEQLVEMHDHLAEVFGQFAIAVTNADSPQMAAIEEMCRTHLEQSVADPALRERLRPDYRAGCKRLVISPSFYDAIQQPNAHLVTDAIAQVEARGVRTVDGQLHEIDVLALATGFHANAFTRPMTVTGRDGARLDDVWAQRPNAYLSISVPDFPNFFMINGPNGPVGNFSLIEVAEIQFDYILQLLAELRDGGVRAINATQAAMDDFEAERVAAAEHTIWMTGCRSWYLDDRGIPASWPFSFARFRDEMAAPDLHAYDRRR